MQMVKTRIYVISTAIIVCILLVLSIILFQQKAYLPVSLAIIGCTMIPFFVRFEIRAITSREIVLLAILTAIAAVSRLPFATLPSIQPTSFVIIIVGIVFGAESGFIVGAIAALASNIFLGQGPWTPWQMYAWGMMGMTAGLLRNTWWMRKMWGKLLFGFMWGYVFGWLMNAWVILSNVQQLTWEFFFAIYAGSLFFDLTHGLANAFFLVVFSARWIRILHRFKRKYGLLEDSST